jgi:hypothetical membrane protein
LVVLSLIGLAIARSPWFSWTGNALSDLGAHEAAAIFNSGLILGGIIFSVFAVGLWESLWGKALGRVGGLMALLTAIALCAIGIFPETAGEIHLYASLAFFLLLPVSLWLVGAALVQLGERRLGALVVIAGVVALAVWALPWPAVAIPEIISSFAAAASSIALGVRLFRD